MVLAVLLLRLCLRSKFAIMPEGITQPSLIASGLGLNFQPAAHMDFISKPPVDSTLTGMQSAESTAPMQAVQLLALVWVIGVAAMLLHGMVQTLRLRLRLREAIRLDESVCQSDNIAYPFVFGLLHPRIHLPFSLDSATVPYVLAHEKAHIARRDYL